MPRNVRPEKSSYPSVTLPVPHASRRYEPARRLDFDSTKGERDVQECPPRKSLHTTSVTLSAPHASKRHEPARRLDFDSTKGERNAQECPPRKSHRIARYLFRP